MNKIKLNLFFLFSILFLLLSKHSLCITVDTPTIVVGTSKIMGKITKTNNTSQDDIIVNITVSHPISGAYAKYQAVVDQSGKFSVDVEIETDISLIILNTSLSPYKFLCIKLTNGGVTHVDISYNPDYEIKNIRVTPDMNQDDVTRSVDIIGEMIEYRPDRAPKSMYDKSPDEFLNHVKTSVSERLEILNNDTLMSKELKGILSKDFSLFIYRAHAFDYEEAMMLNYRNTNKDKSTKPDIQKIGRSYYRFLKYFKLNDPQYLSCSSFHEFQQQILHNEILALPEIGESDIPSWLAKVKIILSDLVGFENGPYYDILAANAYGRQLNEEVRPLSEKQKKNIANYWKNGEIAKILFRKNQQVVELDKFKSPTVVNDVSSIPDDKVIETIVSKHKGKVVFIDLWATWCGPCLDAIQQFRSTKNGFRDKDVAFVYLTNGSSPKKLWEEKIKGIGSEHYYLKDAQWEYIMDHFEFEYIPSYLLYNKEGMLVNKFSAFPGSDKVKAMINGLL